MTRAMRGFWRVIPCLLFLSASGCNREDFDKWRERRFIFKMIKKGQQQPEMAKEKIIEVFQKNKALFVELRDQMLENPKVTQISHLEPPAVNRVNYTNVGQGPFDYKGVEKKFGIKEEWLGGMFNKMDKIGCKFLQQSYVYEEVNSPNYQPPRHECLEFELEGGGPFGPAWTKGIAYYPHGYMPKTLENGFGGQWVFYQYFNKIEDNWYVFSRR